MLGSGRARKEATAAEIAAGSLEELLSLYLQLEITHVCSSNQLFSILVYSCTIAHSTRKMSMATQRSSHVIHAVLGCGTLSRS